LIGLLGIAVFFAWRAVCDAWQYIPDLNEPHKE